jgi:hypothetical protein
VSANVSKDAVRAELIYRIAGSNSESDDVTVPMTNATNGAYTAKIRGQPADRIVRLQIQQ